MFSADSELVVLHVTVKDRNGAYVGGLPQDAFSVVEDGRAQTVRFFTDTDTPVTVGLLIDSSASMYRDRHLVIAGATTFAEASHPRDEIFALAFNEDVTACTATDCTVHERQRRAARRARAQHHRPWTHGALRRDFDRRRLPVARQPRTQGARGAERWRRQRQPSDAGRGRSQGAGVERGHLHDCARRPRLAGRESDAAERSGAGEWWRIRFAPNDAREISAALGQIARDIRQTYTVGYTPTNTARDGAFRSVRVVVTAPPGRPLVVRSRAGYLAGTHSPRHGATVTGTVRRWLARLLDRRAAPWRCSGSQST